MILDGITRKKCFFTTHPHSLSQNILSLWQTVEEKKIGVLDAEMFGLQNGIK